MANNMNTQTLPALTLIKVGGAVVEDEAQLQRLLTDFAHIPGHKVLVHGGQNIAFLQLCRLCHLDL